MQNVARTEEPPNTNPSFFDAVKGYILLLVYTALYFYSHFKRK